MPFCSQVRRDSCGKGCCSAILKRVTHFSLPLQDEQMLSAGLGESVATSYSADSSWGPSQAFSETLLLSKVVVSNKMLLCSCRGCNIDLIHTDLINTDLINFPALCFGRYKPKSKNYRCSPRGTDSF